MKKDCGCRQKHTVTPMGGVPYSAPCHRTTLGAFLGNVTSDSPT